MQGGSSPLRSAPPTATSQVPTSGKCRSLKRKRLNAVLDKLTNHISSNSTTTTNGNNRNNIDPKENGNNNIGDLDNDDLDPLQNKMFGRTEQEQPSPAPKMEAESAKSERAGPTFMSTALVTTAGRKMSSAALRR